MKKLVCVFLKAYMAVLKRRLYGLVKQMSLSLEAYINGCLETINIWYCKTLIIFVFVFLIQGRSVTIIYGRLETVFIWLNKTVLRFLKGIYGRFKTTLYGCFHTHIWWCSHTPAYVRSATPSVNCCWTPAYSSRKTCKLLSNRKISRHLVSLATERVSKQKTPAITGNTAGENASCSTDIHRRFHRQGLPLQIGTI